LSKKIIKLSVNREFQLIGIVSDLSSHKLSWLINSNIGLKLSQLDDIIIKNINNVEQQNFSCYGFDSINGITYNLISNKTNNGILIKKLKNIDFLFQIEPKVPKIKKNKLVEQLKKIDSIISILEIDIKKLSSNAFKLLP